MKKIYSVDRIEKSDGQSFAILMPDDGGSELVLEYSGAVLLSGGDVNEGDVFELVFDGDGVSEMTALPLEREKRRKRNASRLLALFGRKNKKSK